MDLKEAVLQRVDLVELIGQYTALQLAGREWRGRCPFHNEKTASFYVNPEKGVYHCHGCKAGGNAIGFAMAMENLDFRDALEWLARRYNVEVPAEQRGRGFATGEKQRLYDLNDAAARFFREQLRSPAGALAREYLKRRGVDGATAAEFDLGYAPREWTALTDHLLSSGAPAAEAVRLSLIRARDGSASPSARSGELSSPQGQVAEQGEGAGHAPAPANPARRGGYYDYFRHRLVFPIRDVTGRVIGFAGRSLADEDQPKYLNVANTPLYDKSRTLYNLDRAKGRLREDGAVIVEGYMDVIGLAHAGVTNAVASCGTALTEEHVRMLQRYTDRVFLALDGDEAGRSAAWGAGVLMLKAGFDPRVVTLPAGQDPDDFARSAGIEGWRTALTNAGGVVRFWLDHQLSKSPGADVTIQRRWVAQLQPLYVQLPDDLLRDSLVQAVASALVLPGPEVAALLGSSGRRPAPGRRERQQLGSEQRQRAMLEGTLPIEREVIRRLLLDEEFRYYYTVLAQPEWFQSAVLREIYEQVLAGESVETLTSDPRYSALLGELLLTEPLVDDGEQLLLRHSNLHLDLRIAALTEQFRAASAAGDMAREDALHREIIALKHQIRPVEGLRGYGP